MTKHREYPIALRQTAVARVAAGESIPEVAICSCGAGCCMRGGTRLVRAGRRVA
jgi:hypothetical protein